MVHEMLHELGSVPEGLLALEAAQLYEALPGPTLITLEGRRPEPLFVSVLLHGNETTGWDAMRRVLARHRSGPLPRTLTVFVGNVAAARYGLRRLDSQHDYNRIWQGEGTPEHAMARAIVDAMRARRPFASLDIHNTSGPNPHYAALTCLEPAFLHLAALFSRTVVYFTTPRAVQCNAFAGLCPAVTVECGQPGHPHGVEHAAEYIDACLHLSHLPEHPVPAHDIDLYHTVAVVTLPEQVRIDDREGGDVRFAGDLDQLNFREVPAGTTFGWVPRGSGLALEVRDEENRDVAQRYFAARDGEILTTTPLIPAMLSLDPRIIRQDCLCYLMERYPYDPRAGAP
jgi:hypothetical protein